MRFAIRNVGKILQSASGRLFGRLTAGDGPGEELTPAQVRSLCSVYSTSEVDAVAAQKLSLTGGTLTGNVLCSPDNTHAIGATGANRPHAVHVGTGGVTAAGNGTFSGDVFVGSSRYVFTSYGNEILVGRDGSGFYVCGGATGHASPIYIGTSSSPVKIQSNNLTGGMNAVFTVGNAYGVSIPGPLTVGGASSPRNIITDTTATTSVWGFYIAYLATNRGVFDANGATGELRLGALGGGYFPVIYSNGIAALSFTTAGAATFASSLSVAGAINFPPITKSALLALTPTASTAGRWRVTDATPASREAYPDGTNWRYTSDDTIVV